MSKFDYPTPKHPQDLRVKVASENEIGSAPKVWHEGLSNEEGSLWANYLKRWTSASVAEWFLDSKKRLGAKMLLVEEQDAIIGIKGIISEKNSGNGRFSAGIVVSSNHRRRDRFLTIAQNSLGLE